MDPPLDCKENYFKWSVALRFKYFNFFPRSKKPEILAVQIYIGQEEEEEFAELKWDTFEVIRTVMPLHGLSLLQMFIFQL